MARRSQPNWTSPSGVSRLKLFNSLTRSKVDFVPTNESCISWYNCGPTVYDSSHMGHARNYISIDIIRRVLSNYFNYDIFFVQNVTDIDDKIIRRARQYHLFEEYNQRITSSGDRKRLIEDVKKAIIKLKEKIEKEEDIDKKNMLIRLVKNAEESFESGDLTTIFENSKDILFIWLDQQYGHEVKDNSIFSALPKRFEEEYNNDMKDLNILPPDAVTRVSEFVPQIVDYIKQIINKGYAYESNGSVYFCTDKFNSDKKHFYAKLVPEAFGDSKALAEGEGDLTVEGEKKSVNDFALWKCSKPGEPSWPSPWGAGRPGWHIECSVMASSLIGSNIDIHSGGVDLKFPHHDNEIAQTEAYFDTGKPWINYFLHMGHLTIAGCKMSKSLKNFITIKEALKKHSSRQLRILFLLHPWKDTIDYSDNSMHDVIQFEKMVNEFFLNVKDIIRQAVKISEELSDEWTVHETELKEKFSKIRNNIHQALCDNIDTRTSCEELRNLISSSNIYMQKVVKLKRMPNALLLKNIALYVANLFRIFGASNDEGIISWESQSSDSSVNKETLLMPYLQVIADVREKIRNLAKDLRNNDLLNISDDLRDNIMINLGVKLEDVDIGDGNLKTSIKLVDRDVLLKEKEEKLKLEEKKRLEKEARRLEKEKQDQLKEAQKRIPPSDLFRHETDKYSVFDEQGIPTHDVEGKEISKGQLKKLMKAYQLQEKKYNEYLKTLNGQLQDCQ